MSEDMYSYIGRIAAEPVGWTCVALLIGHIRSRQISQITRSSRRSLPNATGTARRSPISASICGREPRCSSGTSPRMRMSSNVDVAEASCELHHATWDNFSERLTRFVALMTGAAEFSVYLCATMRSQSCSSRATSIIVPRDVTSAGRSALHGDRDTSGGCCRRRVPPSWRVLGDRAILAGPLIDPTHRPRDRHARHRRRLARRHAGGHRTALRSRRGRRFARLADRIILFERWQSAAAPSRSNGQRRMRMDTQGPRIPAPRRMPSPTQAKRIEQPTSRADGQRCTPTGRSRPTTRSPCDDRTGSSNRTGACSRRAWNNQDCGGSIWRRPTC